MSVPAARAISATWLARSMRRLTRQVHVDAHGDRYEDYVMIVGGLVLGQDDHAHSLYHTYTTG
jgi:hypothetical protein